MAVPSKCPMCGESIMWKQVDEQKKGFSVGKAAAGAVLLGSIGLVGGALGKKWFVIVAVNVDFNTNIKNSILHHLHSRWCNSFSCVFR